MSRTWNNLAVTGGMAVIIDNRFVDLFPQPEVLTLFHLSLAPGTNSLI